MDTGEDVTSFYRTGVLFSDVRNKKDVFLFSESRGECRLLAPNGLPTFKSMVISVHSFLNAFHFMAKKIG